MKEYIERAFAVQELEVLRQAYEMHDDCDELVARLCRDAISALPAADVVEVVRCPKCEHYEDNGYHFCNKWEHFLPDDSEFFCAFGKRKEANTWTSR